MKKKKKKYIGSHKSRNFFDFFKKKNVSAIYHARAQQLERGRDSLI
jgi:hypothetical protein